MTRVSFAANPRESPRRWRDNELYRFPTSALLYVAGTSDIWGCNFGERAVWHVINIVRAMKILTNPLVPLDK
jgi:hypothetical protein